jgi:hypothetical protein
VSARSTTPWQPVVKTFVALIVWELLTAQLGETGGETAMRVAEWRREHELALD